MSETNLTDITPIIKKPRKPRMSSIVSKAVLLKQMSDSNIIQDVPLGGANQPASGERESSPVMDCPQLPIIDEVNIPVVEKVLVDDVPMETVLIIERKIDSVETVDVYKCDLCDVKFKSKILYDRHPKTIRHVDKLRRSKNK